MSTYAAILDGRVAEIITPPAPIEDCYSPEFVAGLIDISVADPMPAPGWLATMSADHWTFAAPPPPGLTPLDPREAARLALEASDVTLIRCFEHDVPVPGEWVLYRAALRAIVAGGGEALPARPAFPAGT